MRKNKIIEVAKSIIIAKKRLFYQKILWISKKLVSVLATSMLLTNNNEKVVKISYIYYLI